MNSCPRCGAEYGIGDWPFCRGNPSDHGRPYGKQGGVVHASERSVVYRNPKTGAISYPPRNDMPMPERLVKAGFERMELPTLREREKFTKAHNVTCEQDGYDAGSGHADYMPEHKPIDTTGLEFRISDKPFERNAD